MTKPEVARTEGSRAGQPRAASVTADLLHAMPSAPTHAVLRCLAQLHIGPLREAAGRGAVVRREVADGIAADNLLTSDGRAWWPASRTQTPGALVGLPVPCLQ